jgi:glycerophosphoryl diester phosphodiesterase
MLARIILLSLLLTLCAWAGLNPAGAEPGKTVLCVAHRGGAAYAPENTLAAFKNAIDLGADYFELDVHLSSDGHVIVFHDDTLNRTSDGKGLLKDHTLAQLKKLDAGSWFSPRFKGERIPTLEEALNLARGKIGVVIEIKNGPFFHEGIEKKVVGMIQERKMEKDVIIISFDHACLQKIHRLDPSIQTGVLFYANILDSHKVAKDVGAAYIGPGVELTTEKMIMDCQRNGIKVNPWTANDEAQINRLISWGTDAITTDRPDLVLKLTGRAK